jgi:hypothetical protein
MSSSADKKSPYQYQVVSQYANAVEKPLSDNLIMFCIGWAVPLAWWISSCYGSTATKGEKKWRRINTCMTVVSVLHIGFWSILAVLIATGHIKIGVGKPPVNPIEA